MPIDPLLELEAEILATVRRLALSLAPISLIGLAAFL
jgi:hypothetical protein